MISVVFAVILLLYFCFQKSASTLQPRQKSRQEYYHDYLHSDAWQRKRFVVLRRDHWRCVHCGAQATQVRHKKYARVNIGREPIEWLESVCKACHEALHGRTS